MGTKRKKPTENMGLILFDEVGGLCPQCNKPLMKRSKGQMIKLYEIAHIYPNSPLPHEIELLKDEIRLNKDEDHEDNLIALCRDCHKVFDNPRTVEGYREMFAIKQGLQSISKIKNGWFENSLDDEINKVVDALASYSGEALAVLSLDVMKVDEKANNTLHSLTKLKIKNNIKYFYSSIKDKFGELDKIQPYTSDKIYSQVKTYYIQLKRDGLDQTQIFSALTEWIGKVSNSGNTEVSEILISFFVQNCEVYS